MFKTRVVPFVAACIFLSTASFGQVQTPRKPAITTQVNNNVTMVLQGSKHPLAQARFDVGAVDPGVRMNRVILSLSPSKEAQADLQSFLERQEDKSSPDFHRWLTPEEFGAKYGPAPEDLQTVKTWLEHQGLQVTNIAKSGLWMELSGTSFQMETAFKTQMRQYKVNGEMHIANATEVSIPAALAPVVNGVVSLHNFFKKPLAGKIVQVRANADGTYSPITPDATLTDSTHALTPGDYATIYDIGPLYSSALNGTGINIGLVARSDISIADYTDFRSLTNVSGGTVSNVLTQSPDPGFVPTNLDSVEATLDAQWAGGVAQGANVQMIVSASATTTDGVDLSAAFAVDQNAVDVLSVSFGACESGIGTENAFFNSLWEQAAAQGMSVFVSSGDNGAAGCDLAQSRTAATGGLAVSGLASTPFNTAVGGTQFIDPTPATFWSATNGAGGVSALGYIPEMIWNESCTPKQVNTDCAAKTTFSLAAGSGGQSIVYPKPSWQTGFPATADTSRDIPDVSLSAATHDGYVICLGGQCSATPQTLSVIGGTSASSPSFAGIMAIVDQALGGRQGLANYTLYRLARTASNSCNSSARTVPSTPAPAGCVFNDVTVGNNSVPGLTGFNATTSYDLASGLGSVNAANLVSAWQALGPGATTTTLLTVNNGTAVNIPLGTSVPVSVTVSETSGPAPTGAIGLVSSISGAFGALTLNSGAGSSSTAAGNVSNLPGGTYTLTAHYPGDSVTAPSDSNPVTVTVGKGTPTVAVNPNSTFVISKPGNLVAKINITASVNATGTVQFQDAGVALGNPVAVSANQASLTTTFQTSGTHSITAAYSGDNTYNAVTSGTTSINVAGVFGLSSPAGVTSATVAAGQTATYNLTATNLQGFSGTVSLTCSGAPAGTTCTINPAAVTLSSTTTSAPFSVVVATTTAASLHKFPFRGLPIVFASIFALVFSLKGNRKQLRQVAVVGILALGISSCGGGGSSTPAPAPRPPTASTIVVTGTSGTQTSSITLNLTITH